METNIAIKGNFTKTQLESVVRLIKSWDDNAMIFYDKSDIKDEFLLSDISEKKIIMDNLRQGFKELKLYEEGKLEVTTAEDFLNEL